MAKFFISYRRKDDIEAVKKLYDLIVAELGVKAVFWDKDRLLKGKDFVPQLDRFAHEAKIILAFIGPKWIQLAEERVALSDRDWVRDEICHGIEADKPVIKLLYNSPAPRAENLDSWDPAQRDQFVSCQHFELPADFGEKDVRELLADANRTLAAQKSRRPRVQLFGRDADLKVLKEFLRDRSAGSMNLYGLRGMGKSSLAREAVNQKGCRLLEASLEEAKTAEDVRLAVARGLGLNHADAGRLQRQIREALERSEEPGVLVVHNADCMTEFYRETVGDWVAKVSRIRFILCSTGPLVFADRKRQIVGLAYELTGLRPDYGEIPAVQFFLSNAAKVDRLVAPSIGDLKVIASICKKLGGHPQLIAVYAKKSELLSLRELESEVNQSGGRLGDYLAQVMATLPPEEAEALQQMRIFPAPFTFDAVVHVVKLSSGDLPRERYFSIFEGLKRKSLLEVSSSQRDLRHQVPLIAREDTRADDNPALARRWVEFYLQKYRPVDNPREESAPDAAEITDDSGNILAVHRWLLDHAEPEAAATLLSVVLPSLKGQLAVNLKSCDALLRETLAARGSRSPVTEVKLQLELVEVEGLSGRWRDGERRLVEVAKRCAELLSIDPGTGDPLLAIKEHSDRAFQYESMEYATVGAATKALDEVNRVLAATLAKAGWLLGELKTRPEDAIAYLVSAASLWERIGVRGEWARSLVRAARMHDFCGQPKEADQKLTLAAEIFEAAADGAGLSDALNIKGLSYWHWGRAAEALDCFKRSEALERDLRNDRLLAGRLTNRGLALTDLEQYEEAHRAFDEAEKFHRQQGNRKWNCVNMGARGRAYLWQRKFEEAEVELQRAIDEAFELGDGENHAMHLGNMGRLRASLSEWGEARQCLLEAVQIQRPTYTRGNPRLLGNLIQLANAHRALDEHESCRQLVEEASQMAATHQLRLQKRLSRRHREDLELLERLAGLNKGVTRKTIRFALLLNGTAKYASDISRGFQIAAHELVKPLGFEADFKEFIGNPTSEGSDQNESSLTAALAFLKGRSHSYLITIGTGVSEFAQSSTLRPPGVPWIFLGVTDPVYSGIVKTHGPDPTRGSIAGMTFGIPVALRLKFLASCFHPDTRFGFIHSRDFSQDCKVAEALEAYLQTDAELNARIDRITLDVRQSVQPGSYPATVYFGYYHVNLHWDELQYTLQRPMMGVSLNDIYRGAICATGMDDVASGKKAAQQILHAVLNEKKSLGDIPILAPAVAGFAVNLAEFRRHGLAFQDETARRNFAFDMIDD
ncbi:MAG: transcriptional coactivator/pterin dehydratase [Pedosphaera sp.]|nr:transcriptional coactivator/pterin dehydratase [Pedosphaera sp.]